MMRRHWLLAVLATTSIACGSDTPTAPATAAAVVTSAGEIRLVRQTPASGSSVVLEYEGATDDVVLAFSVALTEGHAAGVTVLVELLDASGRSCSHNFTDRATLPAGVATLFESKELFFSELGTDAVCPLPLDVRSVRATVVGEEAGRPRLLQGTFPIQYRFLARPLSPVPTAPAITEFDWDADGPTGYHYCPLPGEGILVYCNEEDRDGQAMAVTITLENIGPGSFAGSAVVSQAFPAWPYPRTFSTKIQMKSETNIRATCRVEDASGRAVQSTLTIPCGG